MNPHFFTAPFYFAFIWLRVQGSGFRVQVAASPLFLLERCPEVAFKSLVTPTIRGKESSHMRDMRSFGSVPTCSGWGAHMGRFRPLRMTVLGERIGSQR